MTKQVEFLISFVVRFTGSLVANQGFSNWLDFAFSPQLNRTLMSGRFSR